MSKPPLTGTGRAAGISLFIYHAAQHGQRLLDGPMLQVSVTCDDDSPHAHADVLHATLFLLSPRWRRSSFALSVRHRAPRPFVVTRGMATQTLTQTLATVWIQRPVQEAGSGASRMRVCPRAQELPTESIAYAAPTTRRALTHQPEASLASTKAFEPRGAHQPIPDTENVTGPHRFKYFKRPLVPFLNGEPPEVVFARAAQVAERVGEEAAQGQEPRAKETSTQSDYRESEVQTVPFTPEYTVPEGTAPELLTLVALSQGRGLPAGLDEVKMIERARQKRRFEASLPPMTDESSVELRRRMMSEQEMSELQDRETLYERERSVLLDRFGKQLRAAAEEVGQRWEDRIEHLRQTKLTAKDKAVAAIQRQRIKALRKLSDARKRVYSEPGARRRDIVQDYADYGSAVYAPKIMDGRVTQDRVSHLFETGLDARLDNLYELEALRESLPPSALEVTNPRPREPTRHEKIAQRKEKKVRNALDYMDAALRAAKQTDSVEREQREAMLAAYRVVKPLERPPTPAAEAPEVDEAAEDAAVLLQRLLRGRAVQNAMFEGKSRRLDLIRELRAEEGAVDLKSQSAADVDDTDEVAAAVDAACDALQADLVGQTLDFLAKELVRFRDERRIAEIVREAERERRVREVRRRAKQPWLGSGGHPECRAPLFLHPSSALVVPCTPGGPRAQAEESGRRQKELAKREAEDAAYVEVMGIHRGTADRYLSRVVAEAVDTVAARRAAEERAVRAEAYEPTVTAVQQTHDDAKMVVLDVVSSFLFPEVRVACASEAARQKSYPAHGRRPPRPRAGCPRARSPGHRPGRRAILRCRWRRGGGCGVRSCHGGRRRTWQLGAGRCTRRSRRQGRMGTVVLVCSYSSAPGCTSSQPAAGGNTGATAAPATAGRMGFFFSPAFPEKKFPGHSAFSKATTPQMMMGA